MQYPWVAVDSISVCLEMEIGCGVFSDWRGVRFWRVPSIRYGPELGLKD